MNIKEAQNQIVKTVRAYLERDELGRLLIPQHKQRPIFLMGPPGIGKTEIMAQTAEQLGINLLSYSMTHHTRQSALGLPIIKQKEYGGEIYDTSEYTMSEIIAAVYDMMKASEIESGILFLDEINCVSETLTPVMLQFLQYKVFGGKHLPDGWVVVTAGNPPEYNSSVRDFDIVTWDRLKRIDVTPDINVWREYAYSSGIHGAVISYLGIKPQNFYRVETTAAGRNFVTARGWDDLARMLSVYERLGEDADLELVCQYIQDKKVAEDFAAYYRLYLKYRSDYRVGDILSGGDVYDITERVKAAKFDERYSLLGLLLQTVSREASETLALDSDLTAMKRALGEIRGNFGEGDDLPSILRGCADALDEDIAKFKAANNLSYDKERSMLYRRGLFMRYRLAADGAEDGFAEVKKCYAEDVGRFKHKLSETSRHFSNMFGFCEHAFGSGQEMLILITELAADPKTAKFIADYGCEEYFRYDKELMFYERRLEVIGQLKELDRRLDEEIAAEGASDKEITGN